MLKFSSLEKPNISTHNYDYLIFWQKWVQNIHWKKDIFFKKWCQETWKSTLNFWNRGHSGIPSVFYPYVFMVGKKSTAIQIMFNSKLFSKAILISLSRYLHLRISSLSSWVPIKADTTHPSHGLSYWTQGSGTGHHNPFSET